MSQFRLVETETVPITPELAFEFRDMVASPTEREMNPGRVKHLQNKAEDDLLVTFQWARVRHNGTWLRMNGQHSATMLCNLADSNAFPEDLKAHIDSYEVSDSKGMASLFRQFDDRKSSRSSADVSGAYQMLQPSLHDVSRRAARLAIEGAAWYRKNVEGVEHRAGDDVYELFNEVQYHPFIIWFGNEIFSIKTSELASVPVAAAIFGTFELNEIEAKKFWAKVARGGDEYDEEDPTTALSNFLVSVKEFVPSATRQRPKPGAVFNGCLNGWNAYREEKKLKSIKADFRKGFGDLVS